MAQDQVSEIIERAFADEDFRCRLLADMPGTLAKLGRSFSPEQLQQLARALDECGETFAAGLDQRLSQSGVSLSPQALLQQSKKKAVRERDEVELSSVGQRFAAPSVPKAARTAPAPSGAEAGIPEENGGNDDDEPDYEVERD